MAKDLVDQLKESPGDKALVRKLVESLYPKVMYRAYTLTGGDREAAEDMVQQAFVSLMDKSLYERVANEKEAVAYLRVVVRNLWLNDRRKHSRESSQATMDVWPSAHTGPDDQHAGADLVSILETLSAEDRHLVWLLVEGASISQVADKLDVSYSAAAVRVHRLRKRLKESYVKLTKISDGM